MSVGDTGERGANVDEEASEQEDESGCPTTWLEAAARGRT